MRAVDLNQEFSSRLAHAGLLSDDELEAIETRSSIQSISAHYACLELGLLPEEELLTISASIANTKYLSQTSGLQVDHATLDAMTLRYARKEGIVPIEADGGGLTLLASDPLAQNVRREVELLVGRRAKWLAARQSAIAQLLDASEQQAKSAKTRVQASQGEASGPAVRFVQDKLSQATAMGASDVHFEVSNGAIDVRFRINGILAKQPVGADADPASIVARLKVVAGMNVSERRLPQDGRMTSLIGGRVIDFRVSAIPTKTGESIVCRILDPAALRLGWDALGFDKETSDSIKDILSRDHGLFIVTGPTGSGKTTTLYTALNHLRSEGRKIITVEDPVEYQMDGIEQIQVEEEIGLTFGAALRSILRHDPNVLMIGEIRDQESAQMACRAAMVGRLVLTTMHTGSPQNARTRLVDLGIESFLINEVLLGVLGQRLNAQDKHFQNTFPENRRLFAELLKSRAD